MKSKFSVVFLKEFTEHLRDRRSLMMLGLFVIMYPVMMGYMLHHMIERATKPEREGMEVAVINGTQAPTLMTQLQQKNVTVTHKGPMSDEAITKLLRDRKAVVVLRLEDKYSEHYQDMRPARIELWYDSASDDSPRQRDIEEMLNNYSSGIAGARLLAHGVSPATLAPVKLQRYDTGSNASRSAAIIGAMLGILFLPAFLCCLSASVDSTAGERERRSLEVLMAQPVSRFTLVSGKWVAAAVLSIVGLSLELGLAHAALSWLPLEEVGMSWRVTSGDLAIVCMAAAPLCLFAAAAQIALAMNSKSYKEAQSVLSIFTLLPLLPGLAVSVMELETSTWMYMVPMLSNQTLLRELAKGQAMTLLPVTLTFLSSLLPALAIIAFASWRMKSERYVLAV
ncbi:ABC transporter permease [Massilia sp. CF038]|uniref:ABC transporter permease n=1 Tax=Massilia sp. CF038 TaxID=1881045 RepID=UPI0009355BB5|nr:ABC transporter permease [Massilia sp. CF038]